MKFLFRSEFIRFLMAGGLSAATNVGSRILFGWVMPFAWSVFCAYLIGMLSAFVMFRLLVFRSTQQSMSKQLLYFVMVNGLAIFIVLTLSIALYKNTTAWITDDFLRSECAHVIGLGVSTLSSYFGHKLFTFRRAMA